MLDPDARSAVAIEREFLIAHHRPDRYSRTLAVRGRRRTYHLCARCTGQFFGFVGLLVLAVAIPGFTASLRLPIALGAIALFPLPAALDWYTQSIGRRESDNRIRLVSGTLLGAAFAGLLVLLVTAPWELFLGGLLVLGLYLAGLLLALWISGGWRRVLHEHFPEIAVPPAP